MANIRSKSSGLPMLIWVSEKNANHGPRIKVARDYRIRAGSSDTFSVSISKNPSIVAGDSGQIKELDLKKVYKWITLNKIILMKYWNFEIDTIELSNGLIKI